MIQVLLFDFFNVILFSQPTGQSRASQYYRQLTEQSDHLFLNQELLDRIQQWHEHYQTGILSASVGLVGEKSHYRSILNKTFDQVLTTKDVGPKNDPETFRAVAQLFKVKPEQILFTDDTQSNCQAAQTAGLQTIHFTDTQALLSEMKNRLNPHT